MGEVTGAAQGVRTSAQRGHDVPISELTPAKSFDLLTSTCGTVRASLKRNEKQAPPRGYSCGCTAARRCTGGSSAAEDLGGHRHGYFCRRPRDCQIQEH